jgi:hypothetical protein
MEKLVRYCAAIAFVLLFSPLVYADTYSGFLNGQTFSDFIFSITGPGYSAFGYRYDPALDDLGMLPTGHIDDGLPITQLNGVSGDFGSFQYHLTFDPVTLFTSPFPVRDQSITEPFTMNAKLVGKDGKTLIKDFGFGAGTFTAAESTTGPFESFDATFTLVPEPSTLVLVCTSLLLIGAVAFFRFQSFADVITRRAVNRIVASARELR